MREIVPKSTGNMRMTDGDTNAKWSSLNKCVCLRGTLMQKQYACLTSSSEKASFPKCSRILADISGNCFAKSPFWSLTLPTKRLVYDNSSSHRPSYGVYRKTGTYVRTVPTVPCVTACTDTYVRSVDDRTYVRAYVWRCVLAAHEATQTPWNTMHADERTWVGPSRSSPIPCSR